MRSAVSSRCWSPGPNIQPDHSIKGANAKVLTIQSFKGQSSYSCLCPWCWACYPLIDHIQQKEKYRQVSGDWVVVCLHRSLWQKLAYNREVFLQAEKCCKPYRVIIDNSVSEAKYPVIYQGTGVSPLPLSPYLTHVFLIDCITLRLVCWLIFGFKKEKKKNKGASRCWPCHII